MKTSWVDSMVVSAIAAAAGLAVAIFIVAFELSLLWSPLIVLASVGAFFFMQKIGNRR